MSEALTAHDPNFVTMSREQADLMQRAAGLVDRMLGDPSVAPQAEEIIKKVNPNAVFPNRASREALLAPVNEMVTQVRTETAAQIEAANARAAAIEAKWAAREEKESAAAAAAEQAALEQRVLAIQTKRGFSQETMDKVLARMRDQNNPDVESAAAFVAESIPKPLPASGHDYLPSQVDVYGGITENPTGWQTQELRNIVRDPEFLRLGQQ
jgi:hypothetical protein